MSLCRADNRGRCGRRVIDVVPFSRNTESIRGRRRKVEKFEAGRVRSEALGRRFTATGLAVDDDVAGRVLIRRPFDRQGVERAARDGRLRRVQNRRIERRYGAASREFGIGRHANSAVRANPEEVGRIRGKPGNAIGGRRVRESNRGGVQFALGSVFDRIARRTVDRVPS